MSIQVGKNGAPALEVPADLCQGSPMPSSLAALGGTLRSHAPGLYLALRKAYYLGRRETLDPVSARIVSALSPGDLAVQAGPFAGMRYLPFASGSGLLPKIVGSYEMEIHPAVAASIARAPESLVNIGAGEGYYAVGYALRLPRLVVHAFDTDILARDRLRHLAAWNGVAPRIHIGGLCDSSELERRIGARTLVVCDCEGCEGELLDPLRSPRLAAADLLVELHVERIPEIAAILTSRFASTHDATRFVMTDRAGAFPEIVTRLLPADRDLALYERSERTQWLSLRNRQWT
jgi:hypothetical protein